MTSTVSRLSKNSFFLYTRMVVLMILSLYTSRVVFNTLGVDDFGVFSVIGSFATMFLSLRSVFAEAIQRFLNYEKGRGDVDAERDVFSIGIYLHIFVAILFCILVCVVGPLYLQNSAKIPEERMDAAWLVFLFGVVSSVFMIIIVPYDAVIIANEKMNVYAWVSIADGVFRIVSALLLTVIPYDSLVIYAIFSALIPILNFIFYLFYCSRFPECKIRWVRSKEKFKQIFSFAGWSFGGNLAYTLTHEGINLILNTFGGVVANAARNIAYQVRSAVNQVSSNTILATKPYIVQSSVSMADSAIWERIIIISRLSFYIMVITALPIIVYCDYLLRVWLGDVPDNAVLFTQIIIVATVIRSLHGPLDLFYMAKGKIKRMVTIESIILILLLPVSYIILKLGASLNVVFILLAILEIIIVFALTVNASLEFGMSVQSYLRDAALPALLSCVIAFIIGWLATRFCSFNSFLPIILSMIGVIVSVSLLFYFVLFREEEKQIIKGFIKSTTHKL